MALSRDPYIVGDLVELRAQDRDARALVLTAPDGVVIPISTARGRIAVQATSAGTWTYSWGDADAGTFEVADTPPVDVEPVPIVRLGPIEGG